MPLTDPDAKDITCAAGHGGCAIFGFSREDSVILAYGSFGMDSQRQTFGAEVIVSADQPLIRHFHEQHDSIAQRFTDDLSTGAALLLGTITNLDGVLARC